MAWTLGQLDIAHVLPLDARGKFVRDLAKSDDDVLPPLRRQSVDEIDDAVLQAAYTEAVHDVGDKRTVVVHGLLFAALASAALMDGSISVANSRNACCAASGRVS